MGVIELIVLVLAAVSAGFVGFCLYRAATRPADDLPPDDDPSGPEGAGRSPVELL
jgi:hypothetical protein